MRIYAKHFHVVLAALAAISCLAATASRLQAAEEKLRWKFAVGEKLDYTMVQDMNMSVTGGKVGQLNSTMRQEMNMTWDVVGVDESTGDSVIKQKFEQIKMKVSSPIGNFDYDSKSEAVPTGLAAMIAPMYKAMTKGEFEITMTARGEVTDVKIPEDVIAALKAAPGAATLGDITTEKGFKEMIRKGALVLPEVAPKVGDTWKTQVAMNNEAGKQIVRTIYTYEGTKEVDGVKYAVIKPKLEMNFGDWEEVIAIKGSGAKKSEAFALKGGDARITYSYIGDGGNKIGAFAVYVVEEGKDFEKVGGTPEVTTQKTKEDSESTLHKEAGRYYVNVMAAGDWTVTVEEKLEAPDSKDPAAPAEPSQPPKPEKVAMKIAEQSSDGEVLFNIDKGRLYSTTLQQKVTIDASVAGQAVQQKIDQKIDVKVMPAGEKKAAAGTKPEAKETKPEASGEEKK